VLAPAGWGATDYMYNCANVHTNMTQILWVDGHASSHWREYLLAGGTDKFYDL